MQQANLHEKNGFGKLKSLKLCFGTLSEYEREFPRNLMIRNNKTEAVQLFGWALKLILKSSVPIARASVQFYCVYKSNRSFSHDILSIFMTFSQLSHQKRHEKIREKLINESKKTAKDTTIKPPAKARNGIKRNCSRRCSDMKAL